MSAPNGIGVPLIPPKPTQHSIADVKKAPADFAVGLAKLPAKAKPQFGGAQFGGAMDTLGTILARGNAPGWLQETFLFTAKEGASAVLPLEAAVVAGRTQSAYRRDGWMEVQERVFEEVAAAAIWLKGVDFLKERFKSAQNRFLPRYKHLSPDIAWNRPWGKALSVDLTAQELFAKDGKEISTLLRLKSVRWLFSVGLALTGVAYVVPTLNQLKTKAIMGYQVSRRKRSQEGDNVQFGDPSFGPAVLPLGGGKNTLIQNAFRHPMSQQGPQLQNSPRSLGNSLPTNLRSIQPVNSLSGSISQSVYPGLGTSPSGSLGASARSLNTQPIRFGGFSGGSSLTQALGHLVDQTPYGSILVVDAGIAGGRGYVASKRRGFETVEVLVRDIGSLYFYILSVPHIMKALGWAADGAFKTSSGLEPKIAALIKKRLESANSLAAVKTLLQGNTHPGMMLPESWLKTRISTAQASTLADRLALEAPVHLNDNKAQAFIDRVRNKEGGILPEQILEWLGEIGEGKGAFQRWTSVDRKNLGIALKQAFRHSVGVDVNLQATQDFLRELENQAPGFAEVLQSLDEPSRQALNRRIQRMARLDALDQAHSLFQRTINLLRGPLNTFDFTQADQLADWLNQVKNRGLDLKDLVALEPKEALHKTGCADIQKMMDQLLEKAQLAGLQNKPEGQLLKAYRQQLGGLLQENTGRLFSLATQDGQAGLTQKLRELLQGGLVNETAFGRQAQILMGQFTPDSREFADPSRAHKMREAIGKYSEALLKFLSGQGEHFSQEQIDRFFKLSTNLNYAARSAALLGTMACIGWLVPHVQTTITKRLTGHDKNPGIASTAQSVGYGEVTPKADSAKASFSARPGSTKFVQPLPSSQGFGNGIFVGQTIPHFPPRVGQSAYQS